MSLRYYPQSKIKPNKITRGTEFLLNGQPYTGKYYETFDGKYFSGGNPITGKNEPLKKIKLYNGANYVNNTALTQKQRQQFADKSNLSSINEIQNDLVVNKDFQIPPPQFKGEPTSYFPFPVEADYTQGFTNRYFAKRTNSQGFVVEISETEYQAIQRGQVPYDVSFYLSFKIMWKLTGPLNQKRISQYDVRAGIIDTNKRLVENAEKTFLGIVDFIGGKYDKFAKPTE